MKALKLLCYMLFIFFICNTNVYAVALCENPDVLKAVKILALVLVIIKIVVPLIIIITGVTNLTKAVIEDGNPKDSVNLLIKKLFVGAFIFFIPSIVSAVMSLVSTYDTTASQFSKCGECLTSIKKCDK